MSTITSSLAAAALCIACAGALADTANASFKVGVRLVTATGAEPARSEGMSEALQLYREGRYSAAYGRFLKLADAGHADAARIAMMMLRHGRDLYGTEWSAAPSQIAQWERMLNATGPLKVVHMAE